jgi:hypothetical protein
MAGSPALRSGSNSGTAKAANARVSLDRAGSLSNGESVLITMMIDTVAMSPTRAALSPTRAAASLNVIPPPTIRCRCQLRHRMVLFPPRVVFRFFAEIPEWATLQ